VTNRRLFQKINFVKSRFFVISENLFLENWNLFDLFGTKKNYLKVGKLFVGWLLKNDEKNQVEISVFEKFIKFLFAIFVSFYNYIR